jgi:hypothetical protein
MVQFLRIQNRLYHVPSIAQFDVFPSCILRKPTLYIQYHSGSKYRVSYGWKGWDEVFEDAKKLQKAMDTCKTALTSVSVFETRPPPTPPLPYSKTSVEPPQIHLEQPLT